MSMQEPNVIYTAVSNLEAHFLCNLLVDSGIEAAVVEDNSQAGAWIGGNASQLHHPKVLVDQSDIDRAKPILEQYEQRSTERRAAGRVSDGEPILVWCEECGEQSQYPAAQSGTVQSCPKCLAYVDVGEEPELEGWDEAPAPTE